MKKVLKMTRSRFMAFGFLFSVCFLLPAFQANSYATAYRYLRLKINSGVSATTAPNVAELRYKSGTTSYPSSCSAVVITTSEDNGCYAFDNKLTTRWGTLSSFPATLTIDMGNGNEISVTTVEITPEWTERALGSFEISGSNDNTNWTQLLSVSGLKSSDWTRDVAKSFTINSSDTEAPSVPSNLKSSGINETSFTLLWDASSDNVGVTGYEVFRDGSSIGTTTTNSMNVTGLSCGSTYSMTVQARDAADNVSLTSTPLSVNTSLCATAYRYLRLNVNSGVSATTAPNVAELRYKSGSTSYPSSCNAVVITTSEDNGCYAFDNKLSSRWGTLSSFPATLTIDMGTGNEISVSTVEITPEWTERALGSFEISGSNDNTNWKQLLSVSGLKSSDWTRDVAKSFTINASSDTEAPSVPSNLTSSGISETSFTLLWDSSSDNVGVTGYEVFRDGSSIGTTTTTSMNVDGLSCGSSYSMTVKAKDGAGNVSAASSAKSVTTSTCSNTDTQAPTAPTNLSASNISQTGFTLAWTASTDNVDVTSYEVFRGSVSCGTTTSTSKSISGLTCGTAYSMTVKAKDAAGNISDASSPKSVTTSTCSSTSGWMGTNFWNIGWGNGCTDPFLDPDGSPFKTPFGYEQVSGDNPWDQAFLDEISIYSTLRFMDFGGTNGSSEKDWNSDRKQKSAALQRPMAYEWMIDMCNRTGKDMWVCIPHLVINRNGAQKGTNNYIKKLAILTKHGVDMKNVNLDNIGSDFSGWTAKDFINAGGVTTCNPLNSNLKIYIEYSNETWNTHFGQNMHCRNEGLALGLNTNEYTAGFRYHAWAAIRLFDEWESVWGKDNSRIIKVDAQQMSNWQTGQHLEIYRSSTYNPKGIRPNAFSIAPYIGAGVDGASSTAVQDIRNHFIDNRLPIVKDIFQSVKDAEVVDGRDYLLVGYEGGQHVTKNANIVNVDWGMYDLYTDYFNEMRKYFDVFCHYTHTGSYGTGGAWGAKPGKYDDPNDYPKMKAIIDWINQNKQGFIDQPDYKQLTNLSVLFPNPVSEDAFTISFNRETGNHVVIYSLDGRILLNEMVNHSEKIYYTHNWIAGLYIAKINGESHKIVIE